MKSLKAELRKKPLISSVGPASPTLCAWLAAWSGKVLEKKYLEHQILSMHPAMVQKLVNGIKKNPYHGSGTYLTYMDKILSRWANNYLYYKSDN